MKTAVGRQVVVALGDVEPDLVTGHLPPDVRFVAEPGPDDLRDAAGAIVRADALVGAAMLDRMPNLRVLARTGVGVERVDVAEATRRGVAVVVTPGTGTRAVAEGALAMVLHLVKRLGVTTECVARGRWSERGAITPGDLDGATIGIVGYGRIGQRLARRARAFEMQILAIRRDVAQSAEDDLDRLGGPEILDEVLERSDYLVLTLPLTPATRGLIGEAQLRSMKATAVLVNVSRADIVDEPALYRALAERRLAGAALDVWYRYPTDAVPTLPARHPFHELSNVLMTPHISGWTEGMMDARAQLIADNITRVTRGEPPMNQIPAVAK